MRRLTTTIALVSVAVAAASLEGSGSAATAARPTCQSGAVKATVGGKSSCLGAGARCQSRYQSAYRKHDFVCASGRLHKVVKPKPKPSVVTTLKLPPAQPLPSGTATIAIGQQRYLWQPNVGDLETTADAIFTSSGPFRIDPATGAVTGPFTTGESADIGTGEGSVWASDFDNDIVRRFDDTTGQLLATVQLPAGSAPEGIADAGGAVWVAEHHGGALARIDPATNAVVASVKVGNTGSSGPQGIAAGLGSVWVDVPNVNAVVRVDPSTNAVQAVIRFPYQFPPCGGIAVGVTAVWVTSCFGTTYVARIDPGTNTIASILDVGGDVIEPAADGDSVWFVAGGDPDNPPAAASLLHLGADDSVQARYALPHGFVSGGAAVAFGSVWLSDWVTPRVLRIPDGS